MKRIVAIVLPDLACELVRPAVHAVSSPRTSDGSSAPAPPPFAVIVDDRVDDGSAADEPIRPSAILHAVDPVAWQYGARPGQRAAQAAAFVGRLHVERLSRARILEALGAVAEVALAFGTTAGFDLRGDDGRLRDAGAAARYPAGAGAGPYDTVWLDVTGCARLVGGDDLLCAELRERIAQLGHRARIAIADGPRIAQALARWAPSSETVVPAGESAAHLAPLPVAALPLSPEPLSWLGKLGILRIADLARLDRTRLAPRLGRQAADLVALLAGRDDVPVVAFEQPRSIVELASFDHELDGIEPLFFVLRGLVGRAAARLRARGEACGLASIALTLDRSILRLEQADRDGGSAGVPTDDHEVLLEIELPVPLASERDLLRALHARLERLALAAPVRAIRLTLDGLAPQRHHQLAMDGDPRDPSALPTLLAELGAWLGGDRVGVLELVDTHRPEARSRLVACNPASSGVKEMETRAPALVATAHAPEPTRLLPEPLELTQTDAVGGRVASSIRPGSLVAAERHLFILDRTRLSHRLEAVEWWSAQPLRRDYLRAWFHAASGPPPAGRARRGDSETTGASAHTEHVEASLFVDRGPSSSEEPSFEGGPRIFLHGWFD